MKNSGTPSGISTDVGRRVPGSPPAGQPLHEWIAGDLRAAIARGDYPPGTQLPTESALVSRYGAARGTVRTALQTLTSEGLLASRRGTPRIVLGTAVCQSFSELRSFAQWAHAMGHTPGGRFITRTLRSAVPAEAQALQIEADAEVAYTVRLRTLDGSPIFVERCVYPTWLADVVMALDRDCASVTAEIARLTGIELASGTHTFDVARADDLDARLLGVAVNDPLLRRRGITRKTDGVPCDYTEDRYIEGSASFTLHNSVTTNTLSRQIRPTRAATAPAPRRAPAPHRLDQEKG
ncbi:MAG TPA: GntR family transcriptional regulator [Pseudonocardiaceae bacterium]